MNTDICLLYAARAVRMFGFGLTGVVLALYLSAVGLSPDRIGLLLYITLVGDACISLLVTLFADRMGRRRMLLLGCALKLLGASVLAYVHGPWFWVLAAGATIGVISPSGNEVGPFLALEQSVLAEQVKPQERTVVFAWYSFLGSCTSGSGSLFAGFFTTLMVNRFDHSHLDAYRMVFGQYAVIAVILMLLVAHLSQRVELFGTAHSRLGVTGSGGSETAEGAGVEGSSRQGRRQSQKGGQRRAEGHRRGEEEEDEEEEEEGGDESARPLLLLESHHDSLQHGKDQATATATADGALHALRKLFKRLVGYAEQHGQDRQQQQGSQRQGGGEAHGEPVGSELLPTSARQPLTTAQAEGSQNETGSQHASSSTAGSSSDSGTEGPAPRSAACGGAASERQPLPLPPVQMQAACRECRGNEVVVVYLPDEPPDGDSRVGAAAAASAAAAAAARVSHRHHHQKSMLGLSAKSRAVVLHLSGLFWLDSFASGMITGSLLAYYFQVKWGLPDAQLGAILFGANLIGGLSSLASGWVAARFGLINTMVFTHLPSNVFLILVPMMPNVELAILMVFLRFTISQMDVVPRQSYVSGVVSADERTATMGITNIVRSLGAACGPLVTGWLAAGHLFGAAFVVSGIIQIAYDVALLWSFSRLRAEHEEF